MSIVRLSLKALDWRDEGAAAALIVAETAILYVFLSVLLPTHSPPYVAFPELLLGLLMFGSYTLVRSFDLLRIWSPLYESGLVAGMVLTLLLTLKTGAFPHIGWFDTDWLAGSVNALIFKTNGAERPAWALVILLAIIWWRARNRTDPSLESSYSMLRWGVPIIAIGAVSVTIGAADSAEIRSTAPGAIALFLVATLTAIALGRIQMLEVSRGITSSGAWVLTFFIPVIAILLSAVLLGGIFGNHLLDTLVTVFGPLLTIIGLIVRILVLMIAVIIFVLLSPFLWLAEQLNFGSLPRFRGVDAAPRTPREFEEFSRTWLEISDPVRMLVAGLVLTLLGSVLARYVFRRRKLTTEESDEIRESLVDLSSDVTAVRRILDTVMSRVGWRRDPYASLRNRPGWEHTLRVRRAYRQFLQFRWKANGQTLPNRTPIEIALMTHKDNHGRAAMIEELTDIYLRARYSGAPSSAPEGDRAEKHVNHLRKSHSRSVLYRSMKRSASRFDDEHNN